jgi:hypothetical protein
LPERAPDALVADKAYDSDAIRDDLKQRGICAVILAKSTTSGLDGGVALTNTTVALRASNLTPDPSRSARARLYFAWGCFSKIECRGYGL